MNLTEYSVLRADFSDLGNSVQWLPHNELPHLLRSLPHSPLLPVESEWQQI